MVWSWMLEMAVVTRRHRGMAIDGAILVAAAAGALVFAWQADVFTNVDGAAPHEKTLELDELLAIGGVFGAFLLVMLRRMNEVRTEMKRRIQAERQARTLALHDALTGLPNRRQFEDALKAAVEAPPRSGAAHALLLLDLNGFKRINDLHGHATGDEALVQVAGRLSHAVREGDLVARLGGDEFAVLSLHLAGAEAATGLANRIMDSLQTQVPAGGGEHRIGTAIGTALIPADGSDPTELLRKADIALYRAKQEKALALSAMRFFESDMDAHVRERDALEAELRQAVEAGAVRVHYQPLVAFDTGRVTGFEALARWTSPTLGEVEPARFISIAEDSGLIAPLTDFLLEQACTDAMTWPKHVTLAFNVSGATLQDRRFGLRVLSILARTGLNPARLEFEITESALVRDLEAAREILGGLRQAGVRIALDDFGTGYSSLYHLRAFKPDKIKIDRSFIDSMETDRDSAAIVQALVGLATGLGAQVTAEGVETAGQEAMLRDQGCDLGQGFLFSAAVDGAAALALVAPAAVPAMERRARRGRGG